MSHERRYPRRLIEVDLPIKEISAHARREKSIRHGHISTLHIWWARRPLAACRAVLCAALWPDPADPLCPERFRKEAAEAMRAWRDRRGGKARDWAEPEEVREALLGFIADFANWDNSIEKSFLETARLLTKAAHESLGGVPGTRPLVVDPFAGGGAISLEALRIGADAFASDLNPVAVLLNKVVLEYIPKHAEQLAEEVRRWGAWVKERAETELGRFYRKEADGAVPIAYLWARTIRCEGPGCGAEIPLLRSLWLSKKHGRSIGMRLVPRTDRSGVEVEIVSNPKPAEANQGTVRRGSATCPCCRYTTPVASVRTQLKARRGGAADAKLLSVVTTRPRQQGRFYRLPTEDDLEAVRAAAGELAQREEHHRDRMTLVPNEKISLNEIRRISAPIYGMTTWGDLFSPRQALALVTLTRLVREAGERCRKECDTGLAEVVATCLALAIDKQADLANSLCRWEPFAECPRQLFARQAIPMVWDFAEGVPVSDSSGGWSIFVDNMARALESIGSDWRVGHAQLASATAHPLPDDCRPRLCHRPALLRRRTVRVPFGLLLRLATAHTRKHVSGAVSGRVCAQRRGDCGPIDRTSFPRRPRTSPSTRRIFSARSRMADECSCQRASERSYLRQQDDGFLGGDPPGDGRRRMGHYGVVADRHGDGFEGCSHRPSPPDVLCPPRLPPAREPRRLAAGGTPSATGGQCCASCPSVFTPGCRASPGKASSAPTRSSPASAPRWRSSPATPASKRPRARASSCGSTWNRSGPRSRARRSR